MLRLRVKFKLKLTDLFEKKKMPQALNKISSTFIFSPPQFSLKWAELLLRVVEKNILTFMFKLNLVHADVPLV